MLNLNCSPIFLQMCFQNTLVNFGSQYDTIIFHNPWCIHHSLRKKLCGRQSGYGFHNRYHVCQLGIPIYHHQDGIVPLWLDMKFMDILCHGNTIGMINNGCRSPTCFWQEHWITWYAWRMIPLSHHYMVGFFLMYIREKTILFFFQLTLWHIHVTLLILEQSIHQLYLFKCLAFTKHTLKVLCFVVVFISLPYLVSQVFFHY